MSKDLEELLRTVVEIMEQYELTPEELFEHIKEYEKIYEKLKGVKPRKISHFEGDGHKSLEWKKQDGSFGYKNLHGSHLKKNGKLPSKNRRPVFHINSQDGKQVSFFAGGYSSSSKDNTSKRDIGIEIDDPINPNVYNVKKHKYREKDIEKIKEAIEKKRSSKAKSSKKGESLVR